MHLVRRCYQCREEREESSFDLIITTSKSDSECVSEAEAQIPH